MKTVIIDNSLCSIIPKKAPDEKGADADFRSYAASVFQCGVDYMEIRREMLPYFHNVRLDDHYILNFSDPSDMELLNVFNFAYVVIPPKYAYLIPQIDIPVIYEINITGLDLIETLSRLIAETDLTKISMIRLFGDFRLSDEEFFNMINWYKSSIAVPLDICPLNTHLTGNYTAMLAYQCKVNSITLCYGSSRYFTHLEEFLILMHSMLGIILTEDYLKGIYKASIWEQEVSKYPRNFATELISSIGNTPPYIVNVDSGLVKVPQRKRPKEKKKLSVSEKCISEFDLEREIADRLLEIMKSSGLFYPDMSDKNKLN